MKGLDYPSPQGLLVGAVPKKRDFAIDDEALRAYFPADRVMKGMFDVYATLFGLEVKEVAKPDVWFD